jgi:hypothetical protein
MTANRYRALLLSSLIGAALFSAACNTIVARVNPQQVTGGKTAVVVVKRAAGKLPADQAPALSIVDGEECGTVTPTAALNQDATWASGTFSASQGVEDCAVTIRASVGNDSATTNVMVNRLDTRVRIDGVSAIAAILIASFAIDRVTTVVLSLCTFLRRRRSKLPGWTRAASDLLAEDATEDRWPYYVIAGLLGAVVLGWFGQVRVLAALGFVSVNPILDALITGLVLMVGADRASDLLKKLDVPGGDAIKKSAPPIEVTGRLVLENPAGHAGSDQTRV